jgi:RNA 3'-terminal phosphate cyclase (ATP)
LSDRSLSVFELDGSRYSGSGTIVRTGLALAALKSLPLRITNIRVKRPNPGLRAQHVTAVKAIERVTQGRLTGAEIGSRELTFFPGGRIEPGEYAWSIGTAGSTTLLGMALLPLLLFARGPSRVRIQGGLFQDYAPNPYHMKFLFTPLVRTMTGGAPLEISILRPGYYPKGGGELEIEAAPLQGALKPLRLVEKGKFKIIRGVALSSHMKQARVSDRIRESALRVLSGRGIPLEIEAVYEEEAIQQGAAFCLWAESDTGCRFGADSAGKPGLPSEKIGEEVAKRLLAFLGGEATLDPFLADQLIPYAGLAEGESEYLLPEVTEHVESNLWLIEALLGAKSVLEGRRLKIRGIGLSPAP